MPCAGSPTLEALVPGKKNEPYRLTCIDLDLVRSHWISTLITTVLVYFHITPWNTKTWLSVDNYICANSEFGNLHRHLATYLRDINGSLSKWSKSIPHHFIYHPQVTAPSKPISQGTNRFPEYEHAGNGHQAQQKKQLQQWVDQQKSHKSPSWNEQPWNKIWTVSLHDFVCYSW